MLIMKLFVRLFFITSILWCLSVSASDSSELLDKLLNCLQTEVNEAEGTLKETDAEDLAARQAAQARLSQLNRSYSSLQELKRVLESGNSETLSRSLSSGSSSLRSGLSVTCSELFVEFAAAVEVEKREQRSAFEGNITQFGKELGEALVNAKNPSDLDELFADVERLKLEANKFRYSGSINTSALNNYTNMISTWQDYLNHIARGNAEQAGRSLDNINRMVTTTPVVPRSKILELKNTVYTAAKNRGPDKPESEPVLPAYTVISVVETIKGYEDLSNAMEKLKELLKDPKQTRDAGYQIDNIKRLEAANKLIEEGSPVLALSGLKNFRPAGGSKGEWYKYVSEEINRKAYFYSIPEKFRPAASGMPLEKLVDTAAAAHMSEEKQWQPLWQFLKIVEENYNRSVMPGLSSDTTAIASFLLAQRYEETGQLASALSSYNSVLRGTGAHGPYDEAKERIQHLLVEEAEALLADQKRVAEVPVKQSRYYSRPGMGMDSRDIDQMLERKLDDAIAKQLVLLLSGDDKMGALLKKATESAREEKK